MNTYVPPTIQLHTLKTADGSATYISSSSTHTLIAGINYPLEVPYRSDEDPESTYIEVSLRPHNGVGMVKERHIEEIVRRTLQTVVLGRDTPRCMLQCTVQVLEVQEDDALPGGVKGGYQGESYVDLLVGAVNVSIIGCLDAGVRMKSLVAAVLVGIKEDTNVIVSPNVRERKRCTSLHAFAFDSKGMCVIMESEGSFKVEDWEKAESTARSAVCGTVPTNVRSAAGALEDLTMKDDDNDDDVAASHLFGVIRSSVEARIAQDERWR